MSGVALSLAPFFISGPVGWILGTCGIVCRVLLPIHQHSHSHLPTFQSDTANALYDAVLSIGGGSITADWRVHHGLGHHVDYLDQRSDVEGNLRFGEHIPLRRLIFSLVGSSISIFDSLRLLKRLPVRAGKSHRRAILSQLLLQIALFILLTLWSWKVSILIFFLPNMVFRTGVFWFSYGQHDDLPMTNVYDSSTTKFRFGRAILNVEMHTAHHERPGLHWSRLRRRTIEILPLIHERCVRKTI